MMEEKSYLIAILSFCSMFLLYLSNDPSDVFLSVLVRVYQLCRIVAITILLSVCSVMVLLLHYPHFLSRFIPFRRIRHFLSYGLLFAIICMVSSFILCIGGKPLSILDKLSLLCCTLAAAVSASLKRPSTRSESRRDTILSPDDAVRYSVELPVDESLPSKRRRTAMELLQTEATYLKNLSIIIEMFKIPLEKAAVDISPPPLALPDIENIFGGITAIKDVHVQIYKDLKELIDDWDEECCVGEVICKYEDKLIKAYPPYVNYYDMGVELLQKRLNQNPILDKFLKDCRSESICMNQPLSSFMIRPVQRLPSMSLLMKDLHRRTPDTLKDYQYLEKAEKALKNILSYINEDKRRVEQKAKIFDLVYEVDNCPIGLVSADRCFLSRLEVSTLNDGVYRSGERLAFYLLSDKLEVAKWRRRTHGKSTSLLKHIILLNLENIQSIYSIRDADEFNNLFIIKYLGEAYSETEKTEDGFTLSLLQSCDNTVYTRKWIEEISTQVASIRTDVQVEEINQIVKPPEFANMLRKGTKLYKRMKSMKSKNE